ncbi:MAG TPA: YdjY domain-containing protein [Candidatus Saccharimonadales bacterium]|nr:YdjY domain-containing protein [Candidatus Saccharimonadales bacterium]
MFASLALFATSLVLAWSGPVSSGGSGKPGNGAALTNAALKTIAPGIYQIGKVRLDQKKRCVSFPAVINMNQALVEYLVVSANGKTHESLLKTTAEPYHIHTAMLLLGAKGTQGRPFPEDKRKAIPGDAVKIEVSWDEQGKRKTCQAEDLIVDQTTKRSVSAGDWTYVGSNVEEGVFRAQQEGSIISLIEDPDALVNNPRPGRDNDDNWRIKSEGLPPLDSEVEVTLFMK